jgi:hypothetical protein
LGLRALLLFVFVFAFAFGALLLLALAALAGFTDLSTMVPSLMAWNKEHKGRLRSKVKGIIDRLVRRFRALLLFVFVFAFAFGALLLLALAALAGFTDVDYKLEQGAQGPSP